MAVRELLQQGGEGLSLRLVAGRAGLDRTIHLSRVQRPGLALTGFTDYLRYGRVQIIGSSEVGYLRTLPSRRRASILSRLARSHVSCFVVTKGLAAPPELRAEARKMQIDVEPITGAEVQDIVRRLYDTPALVVAQLKLLLDRK